MYHAKTGVLILVSEKVDVKNISWDKEGHFINIKRSIYQGNITMLNFFLYH